MNCVQFENNEPQNKAASLGKTKSNMKITTTDDFIFAPVVKVTL